MNEAPQMHSYKVTRFGSPLCQAVEPLPVPVGTQVLLKVRACGVCHSDLHILDGYFDLGHGNKMDLTRGIQLPKTLGHEIVGTVSAVGPDAKGVSIGDARIVYPWGGCSQCGLCRNGKEHLCMQPRALGTALDGGFSDYVMVDTPNYLVEFGDVPEDFAATLACSGLTSYSALLKAGPVDAEDPLLIIGAGGVGLAAVGLASAVHGIAPIVADIDPAKREAALAAGASMATDPRDPDIRKLLIRQTDGIASVIDFVGAGATAEFGLSVLRKGGKMVMVGLFGGALELPLPTVPLRGISIVGSYVGSLAELRELARLAQDGRIAPTPLEIRSMRTAQQTLDDLRNGRISGRAVLRNDQEKMN